MLSPVAYQDILCFQALKHAKVLDLSFREDLQYLSKNIQRALTSNEDLNLQLRSLIPLVFNARIKMIHWVFQNDQIDLSGELKDAYTRLASLRSNTTITPLIDRILLALDQHAPLIHSLESRMCIEPGIEFPIITYNQFATSMALAPSDAGEKILQWIDASLYFELIILCASEIDQYNINTAPEKIVKLTFLLNYYHNTFIALSVEGGLMNENTETAESEEGLQQAMYRLAEEGGSFDFLNEEEDLYNLSDIRRPYNA